MDRSWGPPFRPKCPEAQLRALGQAQDLGPGNWPGRGCRIRAQVREGSGRVRGEAFRGQVLGRWFVHSGWSSPPPHRTILAGHECQAAVWEPSTCQRLGGWYHFKAFLDQGCGIEKPGLQFLKEGVAFKLDNIYILYIFMYLCAWIFWFVLLFVLCLPYWWC